MAKYIIKRILVAVPILIGVTLILFIMLNVVPGDPVTVMMREHIKPELIEVFRERMGLNDPIPVQFVRYIRNAMRGDFGMSYKLQREVGGMIATAIPHTITLTVCAALVAWIIGIPAGVFSAVKQNTMIDRIFMSFSLMGVSLPVFWAGLLMQYIFSFKLGLLPVTGYYSLKYFILPAIVLGWQSAGTIARLTRSNLLEVMRNDYIRTARAKGLRELIVVSGHALKNAMLPVVTIMAMQVAGLLGGAVMTESIFGIPGIGRLTVDAMGTRDMPLLQGAVLFATTIIIIGNTIADLMYAFLDPRIRVK